MNPSHYVSLPLAKRMKEGGFEQSSSVFWRINWKETLKGWVDENGDLWDEQEALRGAWKYQSYFELPEVDKKKYPPKYDLYLNEMGGVPKDPFGADCYAACSVGELGEILPVGAHSWRFYYPPDKRTDWACYYPDKKNDRTIREYSEDTEADARGKLALTLKEKGII